MTAKIVINTTILMTNYCILIIRINGELCKVLVQLFDYGAYNKLLTTFVVINYY